MLDGSPEEVAFAAEIGFFEDADAGWVVFVHVGENAVQLEESPKGVVREAAEGAGDDSREFL